MYRIDTYLWKHRSVFTYLVVQPDPFSLIRLVTQELLSASTLVNINLSLALDDSLHARASTQLLRVTGP